MTNKQLILSLYPKAELAKTFRGMKFASTAPPKYYIKNGDDMVSNQLFDSPQQAWNTVGKFIKKSVLEKLTQ